MTKGQLIQHIAAKAPHLPIRSIEAAVNEVFDSIARALERNERVEIRGFGSFALRRRQPREGRNPKTGTKVSVGERRVPFFTVGKELRERLNPSRTDEAGEVTDPSGAASPY